MAPAVGVSNKLIQRNSVDYPDPEEPINVTTSPLFTWKLTSFNTSCVPNFLFKC